jgi:hypothetical protein
MMKDRNLYFDLDDTLIHSTYGVDPSRIKPPFEHILLKSEASGWSMETRDEHYRTIAIPNLLPILAEARAHFKDVFILTTSVRDYAEAITQRFNMGFDSQHLICRGEYGNNWNQDCTAFLIDNYHFDENKSIREKCRYLGIGPEQCFHWPNFSGQLTEGKQQLMAWDRFLAECGIDNI